MFNKITVIIVALALAFALVSCDNATTPEKKEDSVNPLIGSWENEAGSRFLVLNADGTAETEYASGNWSIVNSKIHFIAEDETVYDWNYLIYAGKLYIDPDMYVFLRTSTGTSIYGTYEREMEKNSVLVREVLTLGEEPTMNVYTGNPWSLVAAFTGNVVSYPDDADVGGKVFDIDMQNIDPVSDEFPSKVYRFIFWTTDRLCIDTEGYSKI